MQIENQWDVFDEEDKARIKAIIKNRDFTSISNGEAKLINNENMCFHIEASDNSIELLELLYTMTIDDDIVAINHRPPVDIIAAIKGCTPTVHLGKFDMSTLLRLSSANFYELVDEKYDGKYSITEADFTFVGEANDGYIEVEARIVKFSRN